MASIAMHAPETPATRPDDEVSLFRLYVLRAGYLLLILGLVLGIGILYTIGIILLVIGLLGAGEEDHEVCLVGVADEVLGPPDPPPRLPVLLGAPGPGRVRLPPLRRLPRRPTRRTRSKRRPG